MAIAPIDSGIGTATASLVTDYVVTLPAGTVAGDVFVVALSISKASPAFVVSSQPAESTTFMAPFAPGTSTIGVSGHIYVVPSTVPATITYVLAAAAAGAVTWQHFAGVDTAAALNAWDRSTATGVANTLTAPAITTTVANCYIVGGLGVASTSRVITQPAGWTADVLSSVGRQGIQSRKGVQAAAGSSGTADFTFDGTATRGVAWQVALTPSSTVPAFAGTMAQTVPTFTQAATGVRTSSAIVGAMAQTAAAFTQAAAGLSVTPAVHGVGAQTLAAFTQAAVGTVAAPGGSLPASGSVLARGQTAPFTEGTLPDADDPAFWYNSTDPSQSVIIGTNKASPGGGLGVYDLSGTRIQYLAVGKMNNADLRDGVFGGRILVVSSNRTTNAIGFFWLDRTTRVLSGAGSTTVGFEPYGCALYVSASTGKVYAFITENALTNGALRQYELTVSGSTVSGTLVRSMTNGTLTEGLVCDDATGILFLSEEDIGFYAYSADPAAGSTRTTIDTVGGGHLVADVEGCAIAYDRNGGPAYVLVSSQGDSTFHVYDALTPYAYRKSFTIAANGGLIASLACDGLDVTRKYLSSTYPNGIVIAQSGIANPNSRFTIVDAGDVLGTYAVPVPTGTMQQTVPAFTQAATGHVAAPTGNGTMAQTVPSFTQAAAGTSRPPTAVGTMQQTLASFTQSAAGHITFPVWAGSGVQIIPAFRQAAAGIRTGPVGDIAVAQTIPHFTQSSAGVLNRYSGFARQLVPAFSQAANGPGPSPASAMAALLIAEAMRQRKYHRWTDPAYGMHHHIS